MKNKLTILWQSSVIGLLCASLAVSTACTSGQITTVETDLTKYSPVVLNVLNLACSFTPGAALCATGEAMITRTLAELSPALAAYEKNLAAGTATSADWNAVNALFATFTQESSDILNLLHVSSGSATTEAMAVAASAETLLAVIEALFPSAPTVVVSSGRRKAGMPEYAARSARFQAKLPPGIVFRPNATPAERKQESAWLKGWVKEYNRDVDAAKTLHPQVNLQHVNLPIKAKLL